MSKSIIRTLVPGLMAAVALGLGSCSDVVHYNDNNEDIFASSGAPVIAAVYDVQDTESANALTGGSLNRMLRIHGTNLSHVKSVTFNGIEVPVADIYATSADSYLKIPRQIPENVDNKLVYTTELGTTTLDFTVSIPTMVCDGLVNEFANAGESVQVAGDYFDLFGFGTEGSGASVKIGEQELEIDSITESYMSIVIPENTPDNTLITLSWTEPGDRHMTKTIPFRYKKYILLDDLRLVGWWDSATLNYVTDGSNDGDPVSTLGTYFRFKGLFDQWQWNSFGGGANWPDLDCRGHESDYVFKFEVCNASSYPFYDSETDWGYLFSINDAPNYVWNPSAGMSFNTYGRWRTISIPLDKVAASGTVEPGTWSNFCMVMQPNTDGGWNIDHSFANFRIEPANF